MKRKFYPFAAIALLITVLGSPVSGAMTAPMTLSFPQGGQFRLPLSTDNPNLIFIPGEKVTAVSSGEGTLADRRNTNSGGVILTLAKSAPFTFYLETEQGLTVSVAVVPVRGEGRVYRLLSESATPLPREVAKSWEVSSPYESLLMQLNAAVLSGKMPDGYVPVSPLSALSNRTGLQITAVEAWRGHALRLDKYRIENTTTYRVTLQEQDFWRKGVRSVMLSAPARELLPSGSLYLYVVSDPMEVK